MKNILLFSLACSTSFALADFSDFFQSHTNHGVIASFNIDVAAKTVVNDGDYCALAKVSVQADKVFKGCGYIDAPTVIIMTKKFEFTGEIRCYKDCMIYSEEPFNEDQFKRAGPGNFTIKIGAIDKHDLPELQGSISVEPFKNLIMQFPSHHPIKACVGAGAIAAAVLYKIIKSRN